MKTIRLVSKVFGKSSPYNTIKYAPPIPADMISNDTGKVACNIDELQVNSTLDWGF